MLELMQVLLPQVPPAPKGVTLRRQLGRLGRWKVEVFKQGYRSQLLNGERLEEAMLMRARGLSFTQIGAHFNVHKDTARVAIRNRE